jgi:hypothetical protein
MAKRQHKTPCKECPFRRTAAAGWLGGMTADELRALADIEQRMPCHLHRTVDYLLPDPALPQCGGRAIYWRNQCKVPRMEGVLLELPADPVLVFQWPHEFVAYHKRGLLAEERG